MSRKIQRNHSALGCLLALALAWPAIGSAQDDIPLLSAEELSELVGPIALYPDDLLAIVLPASTYPLQLVQADRFIQDLKSDATLKPDEDWDDSVVALVNYPEVIELLVKDLDKTWRLGEAVVVQQADVIDAVESFRDRAHAAGNLQSDDRQTVSRNDGVIEIAPVAEDVIYVPYYEPERVVVYQPRPVYHYYPRPYPVYYYPYPAGYAFNYGFFWGVTTAFTVGWYTDSLHVYHHSYYGHPYYGHAYRHSHWYRSHNIHVHNNYYYNNHGHNYHSNGDHWRPHSRSTVSHSDQRVTRNRHYPGSKPQQSNHQPEVRFRDRGALKPVSSAPNQARSTQRLAVSKPSQSRTAEQSRLSLQKPTQSSQPSRISQLKSSSSRASELKSSSSRASQLKSSSSRASELKSSSSRSSQPARTFQAPRSSQPRQSQVRMAQSRPAQVRASKPRTSHSANSGKSHNSGNSGSNKAASQSRSKSNSHARDRR